MAHFFIWIVSGTSIALMLARPFRSPEAVWAGAGALLLCVLRLIPLRAAAHAVAEGLDVYLFLAGMMLLSELAKNFGVFDWLANIAVRHADGSPARLFTLIYCVGTVVTAFMSNDATAVVLTPAVLTAVKRAKANPMPCLLTCALIANAASFVLPISNPANLVVFHGAMPPLARWMRMFALGLIAGASMRAASTAPMLAKAVLIGIDLGPNLSITGSLATILWLIEIRREDMHVTAWQFLKAGMLIMPVSLLLARMKCAVRGSGPHTSSWANIRQSLWDAFRHRCLLVKNTCRKIREHADQRQTRQSDTCYIPNGEILFLVIAPKETHYGKEHDIFCAHKNQSMPFVKANEMFKTTNRTADGHKQRKIGHVTLIAQNPLHFVFIHRLSPLFHPIALYGRRRVTPGQAIQLP